MRGQSIFVAASAALLSALPAAYAGKARVYNHCDFEVYSWSVDTEQNPSKATVLSSGGGLYEETFRRPAVGGVSIKLAPTDNVYSPITQLEYTITDGFHWYDVSNVDCTGTDCPFQKHGLYLESGPSCPTVSCKPGNLTCHGAYTLWDDNWASLCCTDPDPDVVLHLCRDSPGGSSSPAPVDHYKPPPPPPSSDYAESSSTPTPSPTVYEPYTSVVAVTQYATVMVTVTPDSSDSSDDSSDDTSDYSRMRRRRHMHNHMNAHNHRH